MAGQISDEHLQSILLELMARSLCKNEPMLLSNLERIWTETTLRRGDLLHGIVGLCSKGVLELEENSEGSVVYLTSAGERLAAVVTKEVGHWQRQFKATVLATLRGNSAVVGDGSLRRRAYELPETAGIPWTRN